MVFFSNVSLINDIISVYFLNDYIPTCTIRLQKIIDHESTWLIQPNHINHAFL